MSTSSRLSRCDQAQCPRPMAYDLLAEPAVEGIQAQTSTQLQVQLLQPEIVTGSPGNLVHQHAPDPALRP